MTDMPVEVDADDEPADTPTAPTYPGVTRPKIRTQVWVGPRRTRQSTPMWEWDNSEGEGQ